MKFTILQEDFNKGLSTAMRMVSSRGQMAILGNVLIEAENDGVTISATNLELGLRVGVGGRVEKTGSVSVPAKALAEFVGTLPSGQVVVEMEQERVKIVAGKFKADFSGVGAAEYPEIAKFSKDFEIISLKKQLFVEAASRVAFAAASDESRPVLTGIKFQIADKTLKITATDGFRLSREVIEVEGQLENLIIPARTIIELAKILGEGKKEEVEVQIVSGSSQLVFAYDKYQIITRVLEGNFPDVDKIIPLDFKTVVIIEKEELLRAVRAMGIFAREANNIIKFRTVEGKFILSAIGGQTGGSEVEVEADIQGEDTEISFNFRYVLDFLGSVNFERVRLMLNGPLEKGVWKGEKSESLTHLIMPVRV